MVRVFVLYEQEPDAGRYEQHAELCRKVPGGTFRHGRVFGAPMGEPLYPYYAEWEFADREAFGSAARCRPPSWASSATASGSSLRSRSR